MPSARSVVILASCSAAILGGALGWCALRGPAPPAAPCRERLSVIADDGERLAVDLYRCEPRAGRHAALLLWGDVGEADARAYLRSLDEWARAGRALWVLDSPVRADLGSADLDAVIQAIVEEGFARNDAVALVAYGAPSRVVLADPPRGLRALALVLRTPSDSRFEDDELSYPATVLSARRPREAAAAVTEWLRRSSLPEEGRRRP